MRRTFIARSASLGMLATTLLLASVAAHAQAAPGGCDRACLKQALDAYLGAVFKHEPAAAPLTADHYATENTAVVRNGEGFWKDVSGYGELQRRFFDPVNETAAFLGLLKQGGQDRITSVRIRVQGNKVSEAEWIIGSQGPGGNGVANPPGLVANPPPDALLPASERSSRFMMKSLAGDFYQAVQDHFGSWIPTDAGCMAVENGGRAGAPVNRGHCLQNLENLKDTTKDVALRRYPLVDEEAGVVLASVIFVRFPGTGRQDNLVHEYVLIRNDKVGGWWTSMYFLPLGSPVTNGWENRKGGIER
jgi:hypothetical protein